ncbi:MAG: PDZ domain-containing protein [Sphingobacteriales bacterium]|nr:MAG: PDZ domain-containing protein [Sphingobacteriales bacterium]
MRRLPFYFTLTVFMAILSGIALFVQAQDSQSGMKKYEVVIDNSEAGKSNKGFMGVMLNINKDKNIENGVETVNSTITITEVIKDSGAEKAGLKAGDVIMSVNGTDVSKDSDLLGKALENTKAGDQITMTYLREGQTASTTLVLGERPPMEEKKMIWIDKSEASNSNKGFMGVMLDINKEETVEDGKTESSSTITITEVIKDSGAEKAGLKSGDVILSINGSDVSGDGDLLFKALENTKAGDVVRVTYLRDGQKANASLTLGKQPENQMMQRKQEYKSSGGCANMEKSAGCCAGGAKDSKKTFLGVVGETLTAELIAENNFKKNLQGILISEVVKGSAAEQAGLQTGDVLTHINKEDMETMEELVRTIGAMLPGDKVTVKFQRNGKNKKAEATLLEKGKMEGGCCSKGSTPHCESKERKGTWMGKDNMEKVIIIKDGQQGDVVFMNENGEETRIKMVKVIITEPNDDEMQILSSAMDKIANNSDAKTITNQPEALGINNLSLFPNPNQGQFTLSFDAASNQPTSVRISDLSGREIYREDITNIEGNYTKELDISSNSEGIYFLQIVQGDKILVKKLLLQQ